MSIIYQHVGKRKPKKKTKADLEAEAAFAKLNAKWDKQYGPLTSKKLRPASMPVMACPPGRETQKFPSLATPGGSTAKKTDQRYTGTAAKGVALMHKSNYAPVFSATEAVEISKMRRG